MIINVKIVSNPSSLFTKNERNISYFSFQSSFYIFDNCFLLLTTNYSPPNDPSLFPFRIRISSNLLFSTLYHKTCNSILTITSGIQIRLNSLGEYILRVWLTAIFIVFYVIFPGLKFDSLTQKIHSWPHYTWILNKKLSTIKISSLIPFRIRLKEPLSYINKIKNRSIL